MDGISDGRSFYGMRFTESRRGQDYAKPRLVLSRRRGQARGLHANEQSTRASFHRKESTSPWYTRITTPFGGRTSPGDSMRILRVFVKATGVWTCSQFRASSTECREAASYSFPSERTNSGWRANRLFTARSTCAFRKHHRGRPQNQQHPRRQR